MLERTTMVQLAALGAALCLALGAGCSTEGNPGSGGSTSAGSGGSTTSASASSVAASTTGTLATTSAASTGTGAMTVACESAFIDVDTPNGPLHLTSSCPNAWEMQSSRPVAYFMTGGALAGTLYISGCLQPTTYDSSIKFLGNVDTANLGTNPGQIGTYVDASATTWNPTGTAGQLTITKMATKTGETVEGSFSVPATANGQTVTLTGTFRACKIDDVQLP